MSRVPDRCAFFAAGCRILARFLRKGGFARTSLLIFLFNDPQVAEGGFYFGNLVVMYATERR